MTEVKRDKLGRKIPVFDRKAAAKKAQKTREEKHGPNYNSRIGSMGARKRTRGYFGKLKDEGKIDELKTLSSIGAKEANRIKREKRDAGSGSGLSDAGFGPGTGSKGFPIRRTAMSSKSSFRGGTSLLRRTLLKAKGKKSKEWEDFRNAKAEKDRDDQGLLYCQDYLLGLPRCYAAAPSLDLHHIVGRDARPSLVYVDSNLVWLVRECHEKQHARVQYDED